MPRLKIALPNKGRLAEPAIDILNRAGLKLTDLTERRLFAKTVDPEIEILFVRAADIPEYVETGAADLGITGYDLLMETNADVKSLLDLGFGQARLVVAASEASDIQSIKDVKPKTRVATEFPSITKEYFEKKGIRVEIVKVSGAAEVAPHVGVSDLIVDLTSTGTTLKVNRLNIIDQILETSARLIANKESYQTKRSKIEEVITAVKSVIIAAGKYYVMMNVPKEKLDQIRKIMPGMAGPTVMDVQAEKPMVAVHAVVDEKDLSKTINGAKKIGARDILVVRIERIVS
ncbi:MAG: ATP phosphoribosyltransferase [Euryarchaeota archaeon]|nr:ATP phosphoribosyltransferase [Euryarchaeota archaeon]